MAPLAEPSAAATSSASIDALENATPVKKNKPKGTKFRQQKLPAWQPILTAGTVIPAFLGVGVVFIPLGIVLLSASNGVIESSTDYTDCYSKDLKQNCSQYVEKSPGDTCICEYQLQLEENFEGDVYFYYGLTNFYQNHRRYVKSRSDTQLLGSLESVDGCAPFEKNESSQPILPCGAIANSMFNDTFVLHPTLESEETVPLTTDGVAWPVDKDRKFAAVEWDKIDTNKFAKPPSWPRPIWEMPGGLQNVDFMVWMRTAALPTFRKLWRRLDRSNGTDRYKLGLPKGNYTLTVNYRYPVMTFSGTKRFIISTTSWVGGKNNFLGVAYIVVGSLCVVLGIVFGVIHWKFGKSLADMSTVQTRST